MTHQQILEKAIQKAVDGGWTDYNSLESIEFISSTANTITLKGWLEFIDEDGNTDESTIELSFHYKELIFNHDFAKALWGEKSWHDLKASEQPYDSLWQGGPDEFTFEGQMWQYHLQQMVIAEDPIKYLGENI